MIKKRESKARQWLVALAIASATTPLLSRRVGNGGELANGPSPNKWPASLTNYKARTYAPSQVATIG